MEFVFLIAILIFSVVLHEVSHGIVANSLGDPTAKLAGRLTLNPIPHLDPIGSILLPALLAILPGSFIIGWAKPVPVNPANFTDKKYGSAKVSFAGPGANLALALAFGLALRFLPLAEISPMLAEGFLSIVMINIFLAVLNLLPIPPLDGSHILFTFFQVSHRVQVFLAQYGIFILLFIILFVPQLLIVPASFLFRLIVGSSFF